MANNPTLFYSGLRSKSRDVNVMQELPEVPRNVKMVSSGRGNLCIVTHDDQIYTLDRDSLEPRLSRIDPSGEILNGRRIQAASCGGYHTIILTEEKPRLFALGTNFFGECFVSTETKFLETLTPIHLKRSAEICKIDTGANFSVVMFRDGTIQRSGHSCNYELWLLDIPPAVRTSSGSLHTVIIAQNGRCYGTGYNERAQLGNGTTRNSNEAFTEMLLPDEIEAHNVYCGSIHTLVLDTLNGLWLCGTNLAISMNMLPVYVPQKIRFFEGNNLIIKEISTHLAHHVSVLTACGCLYTVGANGRGQLATNSFESKSQFHKVQLELGTKHILSTVVGENNTFIIVGEHKPNSIQRRINSFFDLTFIFS
ncbi:ultraviolet-B receptor UVR [Acrasis kona]|uniref:Ultraviolet-B receptor UVR n=1 Tax=Acrasis kona TaxID=1008807 RepID=A0AAW2Z352_9EUKA